MLSFFFFFLMKIFLLSVSGILCHVYNHILAFCFAEGEGRINLNSDLCQAQMKEVFSKLVCLCINNDVELSLEIEEGYGRGLYKDVCQEYVRELQRELNNVKEKIRREINDSNEEV